MNIKRQMKKIIFVYWYVKKDEQRKDPDLDSKGSTMKMDGATLVSLFMKSRKIIWNDTKKNLTKFKVVDFESLFKMIHRQAIKRTCNAMRNEIEVQQFRWPFFQQQWKFQRTQTITSNLMAKGGYKMSRTFTVDDVYFVATTEKVSLVFCKEYFLQGFLGQGGEAYIYTGESAFTDNY